MVPGSGAPRLYGVMLDGNYAQPQLQDPGFQLRTNSSDPSEQAVDLARLLLAKLPALGPTVTAIRTAGTTPVPRRNRAAFSRAHAEGAVLYVLREHLGAPVLAGDPKFLAKHLGAPHLEVEARAKGLNSANTQAALAALCALPKD